MNAACRRAEFCFLCIATRQRRLSGPGRFWNAPAPRMFLRPENPPLTQRKRIATLLEKSLGETYKAGWRKFTGGFLLFLPDQCRCCEEFILVGVWTNCPTARAKSFLIS